MLHLAADRLAALADESPNEIEAAHLAACPACRREREAQVWMRELARAECARVTEPLTTWEGIEAAMGLPHEAALPAASPRLPQPAHTHDPVRELGVGSREGAGWLGFTRRLAAAAALLTTGLAAGRLSVGANPLPFGTLATASGVTTVVPVALDAARDSFPTFRTTDDALAALTRAERQYQYAAFYLAANDTTGESAGQPRGDSTAVYRTRLAALDEVMAATRSALHEAPHDPVINRYYLATLGAREAAVRQLGIALPEGQSVSRF
jgi:hypothetical protein